MITNSAVVTSPEITLVTVSKHVAMAVAQGYSLHSTQDILRSKGSKHRMNGDAEKRKNGCGEEKKGCGEEN